MLGAIIGDIIGSAYEFKGLKRKDFAPLFHEQARFTDDTVCTIAIVDCRVNDWATEITSITHNHPEAVAAAYCTVGLAIPAKRDAGCVAPGLSTAYSNHKCTMTPTSRPESPFPAQM